MRGAWTLASVLVAACLGGCASESGAMPEVKVTPEQRAKDVADQTQRLVQRLEGVPADRRQLMLDHTPDAKAKLKEVADPALKARIDALGVRL